VATSRADDAGPFPRRRFDAIRRHSKCPQRLFILGRQDQVINPFKKVGASFLPHPLGQMAREAVALQEGTHALPQKFSASNASGQSN
jgi:hypothetical protein